MAPSPHDALFRYTFGKPVHAAGLLQAVLPEPVVEGVDWSTLRVLPGTQVDEQLRRTQSDLAFVVDRAGAETLFYVLVEHKSRSERWAVLQLLGYVAGLWTKQCRQKSGARDLPTVIPILLVQSTDRDVIGSLRELQKNDLSGVVRAHMPQFAPFLVRLADVPLEDRRGLALTLEAKLTVEALLRLPGAKSAAVAALLSRWSKPVARLARSGHGGHALRALRALWSYLVSVADVATETLIEIFEETMDPLVTREFKPPSEQWRDEGREEGRKEGRRELLRQLIVARFGDLDAAAEAAVHSAGAAQLDQWAVRIIDAATLADVFAD